MAGVDRLQGKCWQVLPVVVERYFHFPHFSHHQSLDQVIVTLRAQYWQKNYWKSR